MCLTDNCSQTVKQGGLMLERIMDLHILLYLMAVLGTAGGVGMLAVHLTYRRTMRKTKATTNLREKWLNLWKTRDKLLNRMNLLVWLPSLLSTACRGLSLFFCYETWIGARTSATVSVYRYGSSGCASDLASGAGLFVQRRTGDKFPCGLYPSGAIAQGKSTHSP